MINTNQPESIQRLDRLRKERERLRIAKKKRKKRKKRKERKSYHVIQKILSILFILFLIAFIAIPFIIICFIAYCISVVRSYVCGNLCLWWIRFRGCFAVLRNKIHRKLHPKNQHKTLPKNSHPLHTESIPQESENNNYAIGGIVPGKADPRGLFVGEDKYNREPFCYDLDGLKEQTDAPLFAFELDQEHIHPDANKRDAILQRMRISKLTNLDLIGWITC